MQTVILHLLLSWLFYCPSTEIQRIRSAEKHKIIISTYNSPNLNSDDLRLIAQLEADKHPQYDSVYINVFPQQALNLTYTVKEIQRVVLHFCHRKQRPTSTIIIEYDSLKQDIDHLWHFTLNSAQ